MSLPLTSQIEAAQSAREELLEAGLDVPEHQFALTLLLALPSSWSSVVSTILASQNLTTISLDTVHLRILNEEAHLHGL